MARGTFDATQKKIVESGLAMFLENGYERTNLRDLCARAGITTGSLYRDFESKAALFSYLVQPAVDEIRGIFAASESLCREAVESGNLRGLWTIMDADRLLDYMYRNFDALKLLLMCSDGTKYSGFLNDVVNLEADISLRSLRAAKERGLIRAELPSETEMHLICHAYVSSVFEAVLHDLGRDEMEHYTRTIMTFFTAGSCSVLGI